LEERGRTYYVLVRVCFQANPHFLFQRKRILELYQSAKSIFNGKELVYRRENARGENQGLVSPQTLTINLTCLMKKEK